MTRAGSLVFGMIAAVGLWAQAAQADIKIGLAGPMTGSQSWFGEQFERDARMAAADLNGKGGVLGQEVEVVVGDDFCDPDQAVAAANKLVEEGVVFVVGTSAILRVISTSPTDVQPVFETIVRNAVALCGSLFANVFRFDGELLHFVASHNVGPGYVELLRGTYPMRPDSSQVSGRVVLTRSVVRLEDALADPNYDRRFPAAMSWRRMLGVPMLRQGEPLGVIVVGWAEAGMFPRQGQARGSLE